MSGRRESKSKFQKRKAREKLVRKKVVERRLALRQERKDEKAREDAYEREFSQKQNLGLSKEEIKLRLENNMKILEALEEEYVKEDELRKEAQKQIEEGKTGTVTHISELTKQIEEVVEKEVVAEEKNNSENSA